MKISFSNFSIILAFSFFILFTHQVNSQSLDFGLGFGLVGHRSNYSPNSQVTTENIVVPTIGSFFENNFIYSAELQFCFLSNKSTPFLQLGYSYESLSSSIIKPSILGDDLHINSFELSVGYGIFHPYTKQSLLVFPSLGYVFKLYNGISNLGNNAHLEINYSNGAAIRLGLGAKISFYTSPISISGRLLYDIGTVQRKDIAVYQNGVVEDNLIPTGDKILPDQVFSVRINFAYRIIL